ncbi:MAG: VapC toxin family PIN domain ribonuclease [Acidobacteria bacterium]|nr:MAG: VapC toxin family PIN domain ribonuclease [Acidobacteriota bacterium]
MILDANGLSAIADGEPALEPILREAAEVAVPVIVLGEYRYGIQQSRDRQRYEQWLGESLRNYRVLDMDEETAISYARLRSELKKAGTPIPSNDVWIAALCRQHSLALLSRDRHFDLVAGIERVPW